MELYYIVLLFILGAMLGSFLGCMGYRIPNKIKTTFPSSYCENCKKTLKWYMNIPIISYIFLKGKCAYCKTIINPLYFYTELLCSILFVVNHIRFGFGLNFYIACILTCVLIVTIVSDFIYYYISDRVIVFSTISLIIVLYIFTKTNVFVNILHAAIMFGIMYLIKIIGNYAFKKESLGDGDIKLMGVIGLAIGLYNSLVALFIACILGIVFGLIQKHKNKEGIIPFGPFLLIGSLLVLYCNNYMDIFWKFFI